MTDSEKYTEILKELAQVIRDKNGVITMQNYKIERLTEQLEKAERKDRQ